MMHPRYNNDPTKRSDAFLYHCDVGNMLERIVEMESGTVRQACYNLLGIFWQYAWLGHFFDHHSAGVMGCQSVCWPCCGLV